MHISQPTADDEGIRLVVKKFYNIFVTYNNVLADGLYIHSEFT